MTPVTIILLVGIVVLLTHALEAVTGFGCTALAFPFMILITGDIGQTKIVLSILAWLLAIYITANHWRNINWRQFLIIACLAAAGLPIGILIFKNTEASLLTKFLGCFIAVSAVIQLFRIYSRPGLSVKPATTRGTITGYAYLLLGGVVHGAFATGGPLIVLYSAKALPGKGEFRATMCLLWTALNTILLIEYWADGKITQDIAADTLCLLPFLVAGIVVGEIVHKRVDEMLFKKIVFSTLALVGCIMIFV